MSWSICVRINKLRFFSATCAALLAVPAFALEDENRFMTRPSLLVEVAGQICYAQQADIKRKSGNDVPIAGADGLEVRYLGNHIEGPFSSDSRLYRLSELASIRWLGTYVPSGESRGKGRYEVILRNGERKVTYTDRAKILLCAKDATDPATCEQVHQVFLGCLDVKTGSWTLLNQYPFFSEKPRSDAPSGFRFLTPEEAERSHSELRRATVNDFLARITGASTISQLESVRNSYSKFDPVDAAGLTSAVEKRRAALVEQDSRRQEAENRQVEIKRQQEVQTREFRRTLRPEAKTNCGPVLELKTSLVKVYFPVQGYGNEHWLERDTVYPPGYECRFVNGRYVAPS